MYNIDINILSLSKYMKKTFLSYIIASWYSQIFIVPTHSLVNLVVLNFYETSILIIECISYIYILLLNFMNL